MGMSFSCPLSDDLDRKIESLLVKQISLKDGDVRAVIRSVSFKGKDSESAAVMKKSFGGSGKMILEGSLSFKGGELETKISIKSPTFDVENLGSDRSVNSVSKHSLLASPMPDRKPEKTVPLASPSPVSETGSNRYLAALKLQKTYKSFRTRRQLADCAVLVEQRWWKLLDFAELKRTSVSFFDIERPETAFSRWSRARTRAAKVGKGLSKDDKARKLALQHWLEAIDPRHRYGHNLQFYYINWLQCESRQPFFYWLDIGEGREVNLERCQRSKLQQQCIKYLGPIEREAYQVDIEDGRFMYKQSRQLLDTRGGPEDAKWIFVLSVSKALYVGMKRKGTFQHSSFLAGGATLSAGRLVVEDGILKAVWPHSGHYLPTEENFEEFISFLKQHKVDINKVQRAPDGEEDISIKRKPSSVGIRESRSEPDFSRTNEDNNSASSDKNRADSGKKYCPDTNSVQPLVSRRSRVFHSKIAVLDIPKKKDIVEQLKKREPQEPGFVTPSEDAYETAEEILSDSEFSVSKENLFNEDTEEEYEEPVPKEKILKRINSHKGMKSLQLGDQLSCKWTTGAGPRIGCVRDYPSELQARGLELVNLSPRTSNSPRKSALSNFRRETSAASSPLGSHRDRH